MSARKMNLIFGLLQGTYWMSYCVLYPFLVRFCSSMGYNDFQIGIILTGATVANLVMQPVIGSICDKIRYIKPLFVSLFLSGGLLSLLIYIGEKSFAVMFIAVIFISACIQTLQYIIDIWSVRISSTGIAYNYGFSRSFGSVFYAVTALLYGSALDRFGMGIMIPTFLVCCVITAVIAMFVDEGASHGAKKERSSKSRSVSFPVAVGRLLKNHKYLMFLAAYFIMQTGNLPLFNYLSRKFEILGAGNSLYGTALFIMALAEVPLLLLLKILKAKIKAEMLVLISLVGMLIRAAALAFIMNPVLLTLSLVLQSVSYGIFIGAMIYYMSEIVESDILFTAQTLFAALSMGLSGVIGNTIGGYLADIIGVIPMMKYCVILVAAGLVIFALSMFKDNKQENSNNAT